MRKTEARGHALAFFTVLIWGTTFVSTKVLLSSFTPVEVLFYRFLIGLIVLALVRPKWSRLGSWKQEALYAGAGLAGVTLYFLFENIALTYTTASNVGIIVSTAPFFTALLSHLVTRDEKLKPAFFIGFAIAMTGIVLISTQDLSFNMVGDLLAVGAAAVWAVYTVITRKISSFGHDNIQMTKRIFGWGMLTMIPMLFLFEFDFSINIARFADPVNAANILFLGLGASALCYATWNAALKILGAIKTSAYIYLVPVIAVAASVPILGEPLTPPIIIGIVLTCVGLVVSERWKG